MSPSISRDFIYVDDVTDAFVDTALNLTNAHYGDSFNIGRGSKTTIGDVASIAAKMFGIKEAPQFSMPDRDWDIADLRYANVGQAEQVLGWKPCTKFEDGLAKMVAWYKELENKERYYKSSKQFGIDTKYSVSAIVACYKDNQAIPIMAQRLRDVFDKLNVDYEDYPG